jgi:Uma2 family endonuclease
MAMPLRHPGSLMTLDEWIALPEDNTSRYELQEGVLLVSPRPTLRHQQTAYRLARQLDEQLPSDWDFHLDVEVVVRAEHPAIVRVPDLVVTKVGAADSRLAASDVLLAVEIISPGSRNVDLHLKPFEYAEGESRITDWSISTRRPRQSRFSTWAHRMTVTSRVRRPPASSSPLCRSTCASTFPRWLPRAPRG